MVVRNSKEKGVSYNGEEISGEGHNRFRRAFSRYAMVVVSLWLVRKVFDGKPAGKFLAFVGKGAVHLYECLGVTCNHDLDAWKQLCGYRVEFNCDTFLSSLSAHDRGQKVERAEGGTTLPRFGH